MTRKPPEVAWEQVFHKYGATGTALAENACQIFGRMNVPATYSGDHVSDP